MEPALKGVNFDVNSCEKIGIVGRTGVSQHETSRDFSN
jgi:ABC-type multidrug transport system fused ATPase/permease subunit